MQSPITTVLLKLFPRGFFRAHAGLLLFLFVSILSYCFYIQVLNDILPEWSTFFHLLVTLTFVSDPIMMAIVFFVWLLYALKSWHFVAGQLQLPQHQFLRYSVTASSPVTQFKSWFVVQLVIFIPAIAYGVVAMGIGLLFGHFVVPLIIPVYITLLLALSAWVYVRLMNRVVDGGQQTFLLKLTHQWRKPLFSFTLYHLLDGQRLTFVVTKILSALTLAAMLHLFALEGLAFRTIAIGVLSIATSHAVLIFQARRFEEERMSFVRNFPLSPRLRYAHFAAVALILLLPECFWLFTMFPIAEALLHMLFSISMMMLFYGLLYGIGTNMKHYLWWVFGLFVLYFIFILYSLVPALIVLNVIISLRLFYRNYFAHSA
ncbi:hypothetical protein [Chryseolinea lacunae]|uniref:ABC transporter permease n=1 Tax=Chryseolinea lacunae TaxID=2801331 RepID=A0ABS1KLQ2_9BACT|nr:hypothetical protein [Chryseolinea lacunae]MBL0740270.1 hypothetical protein [Chryseolinea lacunae]